MTLNQWDKLPLLLRRGHVLAVTGWSRRTFYLRVKSGALRPVAFGGNTICVSKADLGKMLGIWPVAAAHD